VHWVWKSSQRPEISQRKVLICSPKEERTRYHRCHLLCWRIHVKFEGIYLWSEVVGMWVGEQNGRYLVPLTGDGVCISRMTRLCLTRDISSGCCHFSEQNTELCIWIWSEKDKQVYMGVYRSWSLATEWSLLGPFLSFTIQSCVSDIAFSVRTQTSCFPSLWPLVWDISTSPEFVNYLS
jgi:hypothetical protein